MRTTIRHPLIREGVVEARAYQLEAADAALSASMLLVMPTAMGKTAVQWLTIAETRRRHPESRVILVAPTNALVDQQYRDLERILEDDAGPIVTMTGKIPPAKREALWLTNKIIVATPQVVRNDIVRDALDVGDVVLFVVDEAHHATGAHAMAQIGDMYQERNAKPLLLGATASPGSYEEQIEEVCNRLGIKNIHSRRAEEAMLIEYAAGLEVEEVPVPVPEALIELAAPLQKWLEAIVDREQRLGHYIRTGMVTMGGLRQAMERVSQAIDRGERVAFSSAKEIASAIRLYNIINLILSQGVAPARESLARMQRKSGSKDGKSVRDLLRDRRLQSLIRSLQDMEEIHSKVSFTRRIVRQELGRNPHGKIIIFANYRDTVDAISEVLSNLKGARPQPFIGQSKRDNQSGMSQKEQLEKLQSFRDGEVNILVATSVGEEGLDVPSADLVIFYEPVASEIRTIQRRGRTGRHHQGSVYVLIAQGTRDEGARAAAKSKELRMHRALQRVRRRRRGAPHDDLASLTHFEVVTDGRAADPQNKPVQSSGQGAAEESTAQVSEGVSEGESEGVSKRRSDGVDENKSPSVHKKESEGVDKSGERFEGRIVLKAADFVIIERERCRIELEASHREQRESGSDYSTPSEDGRGGGEGADDESSRSSAEKPAASHPPIPPDRMRARGQSGLDSFPQKTASAIPVNPVRDNNAENDSHDSKPKAIEERTFERIDTISERDENLDGLLQSASSIIDAYTEDGDDPDLADDVIIFADHREMSGQVVAHLRVRGVRVELTTLPVGDYRIGDQTLLERKTVRDLIDSIIDGRLFDQANRLVAAAPRALLLIEGRGLYQQGRIGSEALMGALSTLAIDIGLPVFSTADGVETARFLLTAARREQIALKDISRVARNRMRRGVDSEHARDQLEMERPGSPTGDIESENAAIEAAAEKPKQDSRKAASEPEGDIGKVSGIESALIRRERLELEQKAIALLSGLPGVGKNRATNLLETFGNIQSVAAASEQELETVEGVGPSTAASIHSVLTSMRR